MAKTIIHATLEVNFTKKSASAITGDQLGAETFASWKSAVEACRRAFYKYEEAKHIAAGMGKDGTIDKAISDNAFDALQAILDLVGEVNGHPIVKNQSLLDELAVKAVSEKEPLAGRALTVKSQLDNAKARLDALNYNGVNPESVESIEAQIAELEEELKIAKKETGSCAPMGTRVTESTFRKKFEKALYALAIEKQALKSWEELEAEEEARKAERKARAKAKRAAKREAERAAKAVETVAA